MRHDEGTEAQVMARQGTIHRVTGETDVKVRLDLDGSGQCQASTGVPFLDHMLHQISSHGLIDLEINAVGDTHIDDHHTNEDVGIAVGQALARALEVSAYSLAPLCKHAKPLFSEGASVITLSYLGAERAIPNYNVMGVAKAALEASVRYLAAELGEKQVRVNAISAGPIRTLASSAIGGILDMIHNVEEKAPLRRTVTQMEVGGTAAFLLSDLASGISGQTIYVDAGYCVTGM